MNLRWVHALLILLSAALAVLFGLWCLDLYGREDGTATSSRPLRRRRVVRLGHVRLMVPAQDKDAAMRASRSVSESHGFTTAAAVVIGGSSSVFACPVCFGRRRPR